MTSVTIRPSEPSDVPAIARIYAHHVLNGTASFEESAPTESEMAERRDAVVNAGFPYLAAELNGKVVGYAYLSSYRPRSAYRFTVENSIYVAHDAVRQGIGRALLAELLRIAEAGPWQQMMAVISDPASGSEALHGAFGFRKVGQMEKIGFKFETWIDVVVMQRAVG
ncbi:MAG: GNAT family N-acetyltransferase [Alphaproteobacteria bacterium]|nr:GNAT family N-acetyltransferase [Alphaproteobacteria bacterium]